MKPNGASFARILAERKFVDVAVQMLRRHMVESALVAALQARPNAFNAICVNAVVTDIFASGMIDCIMRVSLVCEAFVG